VVLDPHKHYAPWKGGSHKNQKDDKDRNQELEKLKGAMIPSPPEINEIFSNMHHMDKGDNFQPYDLAYKVGGLTETARNDQ